MIRALTLWLLAGLVAGPAFAAKLLVQVDNAEPELGEVFAVHLTLVDGRADGPPPLEIPGLSLAYQGVRQSATRAGGQTVRTLTWSFAATPLAEGSLIVPPVEMDVGGETLRSEPVRIEVVPKVEIEGDSAITGGLSATEAWLGQVLVYHLEFRTRLRVLDMRWTPPPLEGLVAEQSTSTQSGERRAAIDGKAWTIAEIDMPLVAVAAGSRQVNPAVLTVEVPTRSSNDRPGPLGLRTFTNTKRELFSTQPQKLVVRELPEAGRTEAWSGLVGSFNLDVRLSDEQVALGESATLEVRLRGDGTLTGFELPPAPEDAGYSAYDDDPDLRTRVEGGEFTAEGIWRRAIVPEREGTLELDAVEIQVFDPQVGEYVTLRSPPIRLEVVEGERGDGVSSFTDRGLDGRQDVATLADDILPIHPRVSARSQLFDPRGAAIVGGAPWALLLALLLKDALAGRQRKEDPRRALLRRVDAAGQADLGTLEALLRDALSLHLGRPAAGLDRDAVAEGLQGDARDAALALYDDLSAARYGGGVGEGLRVRVLQFARALIQGAA
ncbi:MAG: BatD family protein [Alphaproteobacteria bacterium]|nr:BatD family protein [Alphaproteobacteria bacterium]